MFIFYEATHVLGISVVQKYIYMLASSWKFYEIWLPLCPDIE